MNNIYKAYNQQHNLHNHLDYVFYTPIENYVQQHKRAYELSKQSQKIEDSFSELSDTFFNSMNDLLSIFTH